MKMNNRLLLILVGLSFAFRITAQQAAISEDDLRAYVAILDSVGIMTDHMRVSVTESIKNNPNLSSERYNVLSQAGTDSVKLKEAKATSSELAALKEINKKRETEAMKIQEAYRSLITAMGSTRFNQVRTAIKDDPPTKGRYDALLAQRQKARARK